MTFMEKEIIKKAWKEVFKYPLEEMGKDLIMENGTPRNIVKFGKRVLELSKINANK